ncbi:MAG: hypothetical protein LWY06_08175 [Firmicutes bacterium]|nr:hypothetical protein [Bacillota bacterium]
MKTRFMLTAIIALMLGFMGSFTMPADSAAKYTDNEIKTMVRDIQTLNLLNSLNLTKDQMQQMLSVAKEVKKTDDELKNLYDRKYNEMHGVLQEMRTELMSKTDLSDSLKKRYHDAENEIKVKQVEYTDKQKEWGKKMQSVLNENQKVMLKEYQPCLVPVKNIANPERIGQAGNNERIAKMLGKIRKLPDDKYAQAKQMFLEKTKERVKMMIPDDAEREKAVKNAEAAMDKARKMSDEEFELKKDELAGGILPKKAKPADVENNFTKQFLLNPNLASILEAKIKSSGK